MTRGLHDPDSPGRPVRLPTDRQVRSALARDLSLDSRGVDYRKVTRIMFLPLMEVALLGASGMAQAARARKEAA